MKIISVTVLRFLCLMEYIQSEYLRNHLFFWFFFSCSYLPCIQNINVTVPQVFSRRGLYHTKHAPGKQVVLSILSKVQTNHNNFVFVFLPAVGLTPCISPIPQLDEKLLCRRVSEHSDLEIIRREDIPEIIETQDTMRDGPGFEMAQDGVAVAFSFSDEGMNTSFLSLIKVQHSS